MMDSDRKFRKFFLISNIEFRFLIMMNKNFRISFLKTSVNKILPPFIEDRWL
jgi:hypothetical protein